MKPVGRRHDRPLRHLGRGICEIGRCNLRLVIAAANELLTEQNSSLSMDAVARRAGVTRTIYRQFPNKQALLALSCEVTPSTS
jgi:hypothetical protein